MNNCYDKFESFLDKMKKTDVSKIFTEDVSFPEFMQLKIIKYFSDKAGSGSVQVSVLVENSCVTAQAISKCLRILERKNFIERSANKDDRRITEVRLTDEGERVFEITRKEFDSVMSEVFSDFSDTELKSFEILSGKFLDLYASAINRRITL